MKIIDKMADGVFLWHNGMVGTKDLPMMLAFLSRRVKKTNHKTQHLLDNIKIPTKAKPTWKQQLAAIRPRVRVV